MTEVLTYEALKADRDAQQKRADALAVENAELKARTVTVPAKLYVKDMRCNVVRWSQVIDAISEAGVAFVRDDGELIAGTRETPATDAALAAIQKQAGIEAVEEAAYSLYGKGYIFDTIMDYAAELREAK